MSDSALARRRVMRNIREKWAIDDRGSAAIEYAILVGVVALLAIHAFSVFGTDVSTVLRGEGADVAKLGF
jgi:Flp pilus assembly pilin Flp